MDLRDRRGRDRLGVEAREDVPREFLRDHLPDRVERHRRHLVDELPKLVDVRIRQQVGPRREQLAELDVGRPELLECLPKLDRALTGRGPLADDAELAQDAQDARPTRDARDMHRTARTLDPGPHQGRIMTRAPVL